MDINLHFQKLLDEHWVFTTENWPTQEIANNHRTSGKMIPYMKNVKDTLMNRLGPLPVFYFLVVIWSQDVYPGPYREVEKGLLLLYHLVSGKAMVELSPHIPKSSFHAIHTEFYKIHKRKHTKMISNHLANMFSTFPLRYMWAKLHNPPLFQHVTLHLDGHDTRLSCEEKSSADMYSYKLKKAGVRTQVCTDCMGMTILVSKSMPCKDNNDGTMLVAMKIHKHIHPLDVIAVDGGYPQYIKKLMDDSDLTKKNFCYPIRKHRGKDFTKDESEYNSTFGSFRSQIEATFGDLGTIFAKHNNRRPVLVSKIETYNLQLQLCLLLMNIKKMVGHLDIEPEPIHSAWTRDGFDYPTTNGKLEQNLETIPVADMLKDIKDMAMLQDEFMRMNATEMEEDE